MPYFKQQQTEIKMSEGKGNVFKRISQVMKAVGIVEKTGKVNFGGGWEYASDYDILVKVNPAMVAAGLVMFPIKVEFIQSSSGLSGLETMMMTYRVSCTDNASYVDIIAIGQGVDRQDKAFAKAQTMCLKYALRQLLLIPTGDDPDNITEDPEKDIKKLILKSTFKDNEAIKKIGGAKMEWDRSGPGKDTFLHWWVEDTEDNRKLFKAYLPTDMLDKIRQWSEKHYHGFEEMDLFCVEKTNKGSIKKWDNATISDFMVQMDSGNGVRSAYDAWYRIRYAKDEMATHNDSTPF